MTLPPGEYTRVIDGENWYLSVGSASPVPQLMRRPPMNLVEQVARVIASEQGDDFDQAFDSKAEWTASRGIRHGCRFRDINEPMKPDFLCAANGAIITILAAVDAHLSAVQYDPAPYAALKARLAKVREECEAGRTPPQAPLA